MGKSYSGLIMILIVYLFNLSMSNKKSKSLDFIADKDYKLFSAKTKDGVAIGPRIKGKDFHLTAYSKGKRASIHTTRKGKREKTIVETDKKTKYFSNLEKELAQILLTDEFSDGDLFEVKSWFLQESENIRKLPRQGDLQFNGVGFVLRVLNKANGTKKIADFNKPVRWEDIDKYKLLSNKNNDLLFVYKSKVYRLTAKNAIELVNFVFEKFGVNYILSELGLQKEIFTSLLENI
jgi:hypothetical protein